MRTLGSGLKPLELISAYPKQGGHEEDFRADFMRSRCVRRESVQHLEDEQEDEMYPLIAGKRQ
jgi:hypothetical protein